MMETCTECGKSILGADESERINEYDGLLGRAAEIGSDALRDAWVTIPKQYHTVLKAAFDRRHKVVAMAADAKPVG